MRWHISAIQPQGVSNQWGVLVAMHQGPSAGPKGATHAFESEKKCDTARVCIFITSLTGRNESKRGQSPCGRNPSCSPGSDAQSAASPSSRLQLLR
eukprot:Skav214163  [mRNA]  locus=scaffold945:186614:186914:+ [translate_table: standard]